MRILFIGCVESSKVLLKKLVENHYDICGVVTKKESAFNADFCDLTDICKRNNIRSLYVKNANDEESIAFIREMEPDVIYCFGWSQLLCEEVLSIPKQGAFGFHPAKLPANKGRHPVIWALALGLEKTAVSFFRLNVDADTGVIVSQQEIKIAYEDDARSLYDKIMHVAQVQMLEFTAKLQNGEKLPAVVENISGNVWRKRGRADGVIDWRMSSRAIYNLVRALTRPYVGAEFIYNGEVIKVWKVEEVVHKNIENIEYGKVLKVNSDTDYFIKVYDNIIHVLDCDPVELMEGEYL